VTAWHYTCPECKPPHTRGSAGPSQFEAPIREVVEELNFGVISEEHEVAGYTERVVGELISRGWCAATRMDDLDVSADEVGIWRGDRREHWDVCVSAGNGMCDTSNYFLAASGRPR